jgi:hypothetical protein
LNSWNKRDLPVPARHHCHDLPVAVGRLRECALQLLKLALAPDEFRQPAPRREVEVRPK